MSSEINNAFVNTYRPGAMLLAQQMKCKLEDAVLSDGETGEQVFTDQVGVVAARRKITRHTDTEYVTTPHRRRRVLPEIWRVSDLLAPNDMLKVMNKPGGSYIQAFIAAINRARDTNIIANMLGTAFTGKDGLTSVALPGTQQIAAGGTGFTLAKVRSAMDILASKAIFDDEDQPELHVAWTRKQEGEFMDTTEVKSADFNTQYVLMKGGMSGRNARQFYGFYYHRLEDWIDELGNTNRILPKVSTTRSCVAWVKGLVLHNVWERLFVSVDQLTTKEFDWQHYVRSEFGSTRLQEEGVVQIDVNEP